MVIDRATLDDIAELCDLLAILFSQEVEFKPDANAQAIGLRMIVSHPETGIILVARHNGKIIGMVCLLFTVSTALGARVAILEDMLVLPTQRGLGIGTDLLTAAIVTARENDCKRITLLTDSSNEIAHSFYEKQGFMQSQMLAFRILLT
jgi:GNAT superfamily N-acetyltransferase